MDHIEFPNVKKVAPPTGISSPSVAYISSGIGGDELTLLDEDGNERLVFKGLKTYRVINGKKILWDVENDKPVEKFGEDWRSSLPYEPDK